MGASGAALYRLCQYCAPPGYLSWTARKCNDPSSAFNGSSSRISRRTA
jgi:hypothetical protein